MCGICGVFSPSSQFPGSAVVENMTRSLLHRGPDASACWLDVKTGVGFGHSRLSVIDIAGGQQPMATTDGRLVISFNGELYNHVELRADLESAGVIFRTKSDTEVLIEAFRRWGQSMLSRLRGMFALAIYDRDREEVFLARDRVGIKPLYYWFDPDKGLYFGSELKAILAAPAVPRRLNYSALKDILMLSYAQPSNPIFEGIHELEPGCWLRVGRRFATVQRYWHWSRRPSPWSYEDAVARTEEVLVASLEEHLISDVPIGAFLSGGVDSSVLLALIAKRLNKHIPAFTVSFNESGYEELPHAKRIAESLGIPHHVIRVANKPDNLALVNTVLDQFDMPFGDSSAIPTYIVCREIRKHVKVALAGDGGDEMFGGYPRFQWADLAKRVALMPPLLLGGIRVALESLGPLMPQLARKSRRFLRAVTHARDRLLLLSCYVMPGDLGIAVTAETLERMNSCLPMACLGMRGPGGPEFVDATIAVALPGDYLRKVDMMSGFVGLEVRVPYLGDLVLEHASHLPHSFRYTLRRSKLILRDLAKRLLPSGISELPKAGFGIPLDSWLGDSGRREMCASLLSPSIPLWTLLRREYIEEVLSAFRTGTWNQSRRSRFMVYQQAYLLWALNRWLERWKPAL